MAVAEGAKGKGAEVSVITAAEFSPEQGRRVFRHRLWLPLHGVGAAGGERIRVHVHRL